MLYAICLPYGVEFKFLCMHNLQDENEAVSAQALQKADSESSSDTQKVKNALSQWFDNR